MGGNIGMIGKWDIFFFLPYWHSWPQPQLDLRSPVVGNTGCGAWGIGFGGWDIVCGELDRVEVWKKTREVNEMWLGEGPVVVVVVVVVVAAATAAAAAVAEVFHQHEANAAFVLQSLLHL